MTDAPAPDPAEIARKLSPAQKRALLWLPADGSRVKHTQGSPGKNSLWSMCSVTKGNPTRGVAITYSLVGRQWISMAAGTEFWLTPLGRKIRAELEKEAGR